jgi:dienelactone hydrolase
MGARLSTLLFALVFAAGAASAQEYKREQMRIPMAAAGERGLEALFFKPDLPGRLPLVLLNHGSPRGAEDRPGMAPQALERQALEFARRGFAVVVVMRRGFGDSGGGFAETPGPCANANFTKSAAAAVADLRATIAHLTQRPDIDATRIISVGVSAGGFASVALSAENPPGLVAAINFAGGRGSPKDDEVCSPDRLVDAFATFGKSSRAPTLWVYSENDRYFGPEIAQRFYQAFAKGGGKAEFIKAPPFDRDGHALFGGNIPGWTPYVDGFLKEQNLVLRDKPLALPPRANIAPPKQLNEAARKSFERFLDSPPHRAFAVSPKGHYGWRAGRRTIEDARKSAIERCAEHDEGCAIFVVDDKAAP